MIGVKIFIEEFKESFDRNSKATSKAQKIIRDRGDKVTKENLSEEVSLILAEWDRKIDRGINVQKKLCEKEIATNKNAVLGVYSPYEEWKTIDKNICKLENNKTYLEKCLFSTKHGIIGYADRIDVKRNTINITDNKVIEKIYRSSSFTTDKGFKVRGATMQAPLSHLDQCNYNDIVLQISLYMYLAWENNKSLKIGKLYIRQIIMNDKDKITSNELIEVPYMKEEVIKMFKFKKLNEG